MGRQWKKINVPARVPWPKSDGKGRQTMSLLQNPYKGADFFPLARKGVVVAFGDSRTR
jgi:hypothetical protein